MNITIRTFYSSGYGSCRVRKLILAIMLAVSSSQLMAGYVQLKTLLHLQDYNFIEQDNENSLTVLGKQLLDTLLSGGNTFSCGDKFYVVEPESTAYNHLMTLSGAQGDSTAYYGASHYVVANQPVQNALTGHPFYALPQGAVEQQNLGYPLFQGLAQTPVSTTLMYGHGGGIQHPGQPLHPVCPPQAYFPSVYQFYPYLQNTGQTHSGQSAPGQVVPSDTYLGHPPLLAVPGPHELTGSGVSSAGMLTSQASKAPDQPQEASSTDENQPDKSEVSPAQRIPADDPEASESDQPEDSSAKSAQPLFTSEQPLLTSGQPVITPSSTIPVDSPQTSEPETVQAEPAPQPLLSSEARVVAETTEVSTATESAPEQPVITPSSTIPTDSPQSSEPESVPTEPDPQPLLTSEARVVAETTEVSTATESAPEQPVITPSSTIPTDSPQSSEPESIPTEPDPQPLLTSESEVTSEPRKVTATIEPTFEQPAATPSQTPQVKSTKTRKLKSKVISSVSASSQQLTADSEWTTETRKIRATSESTLKLPVVTPSHTASVQDVKKRKSKKKNIAPESELQSLLTPEPVVLNTWKTDSTAKSRSKQPVSSSSQATLSVETRKVVTATPEPSATVPALQPLLTTLSTATPDPEPEKEVKKQTVSVSAKSTEKVNQVNRVNPFIALFIQPVQRVCQGASDKGKKFIPGLLARAKKWLSFSKAGNGVKRHMLPPAGLLKKNRQFKIRGYRANPLYVLAKLVFLNVAIYGGYRGWRWMNTPAGHGAKTDFNVPLLPKPPMRLKPEPQGIDKSGGDYFAQCPENMQPEIVRLSCNQAMKAGAKEAAGLLAAMGMKPRRHHLYPATGIINLMLSNQLIREFSSEQGCSFLEYGQIGYVPLGEERHYSPVYPIKTDELRMLLTESAEILAGFGIRDEENTSHLEMALTWCGIPVVQSAREIQRQCINTVAAMLHANDEWFGNAIHQLYLLYFAGAINLDKTTPHLAFQPGFHLTDDCQLGQFYYTPRVVSPDPVTHRFFDRLITSPSGGSSDRSTVELPEHYTLEILGADHNWVWDGINRTRSSSLDDLDSTAIYRLSVPDENYVRFLGIKNEEPLLSPADVSPPENLPEDDWGRLFGLVPEVMLPPQQHIQEDKAPEAGRVMSAASLITSLTYFFASGNQMLAGLMLLASAVTLDGRYYWRQTGKISGAPPNPEDDELIRQEGLGNLLEYYSLAGEFSKANMLSALAMDYLPLGVIEFAKDQVISGSIRYSSLFSFPGAEQVSIFNRAYRGCVSLYQGCDSTNREHIEYLRFQMMVCGDLTNKQCRTMWQDEAGSRSGWQLALNSMDWPERGSIMSAQDIPFDHYLSRPVLSKEEKIMFYVLVQSLSYSAPKLSLPQRVLIKGHFLCSTNDECLRSSNGGTPEGRFTLVSSNRESKSMYLEDLFNPRSLHTIVFSANAVLVPHWNRERTWFRKNVQVISNFDENCSTIRNDNLRTLCSGLNDREKKRWMEDIFYLDRIFSPDDLIPVYIVRWLPGDEDKPNPAVQVYPIRKRATFHVITPERIRQHLELLDSFSGLRQYDPGGASVLLQAGILYEEGEEAFANSGESLVYSNRNEVYQLYYREVNQTPKLITSALGQCFRKHLRLGDLENPERHFLLHTWIVANGIFRVEYLPDNVSFQEEHSEGGTEQAMEVRLECHTSGYHAIKFGGPDRVQLLSKIAGVSAGCSEWGQMTHTISIEKGHAGMIKQVDTGFYDFFILEGDRIYHDHCYPSFLYQEEYD